MEQILINNGYIYIIILGIVFWMFRKMLYSIFDPSIWIIPLFSSLLALSYFTNLFWYILFAVFAFWIGMVIVTNNKVKRNFAPTNFYNIEFLEVFTYLVFIIYTLSCILTFIKGGIPLFSDNPTNAKIAVFEGIGILRRISFLGSILPINLSILIFIKHNNKKYLLLLFFYCAIKLLLGSKSSIIGLVFPLYYFMTQKNILRYKIDFKKYRNRIIYIGIVAVIIFVVIVTKEAQLEGESLFVSIGFRLMEFGDVMLLYSYDNVQEAFNTYNGWDFLPDEFNGILGMLRLAEYKDPLGYIMMKAMSGEELDTIVGPNTPAPIKGHIYFGIGGGIIYSFLLGYIFAKFRKYFFEVKIRNIYHYSVMAFIFFSLMGLVRDSTGFISLLFDYFFYTAPLYILTYLSIKIYGRRKVQSI